MAPEKNYPNLGSLAIVEKILDDAAQCLSDPSRTAETSSIPELLGVLFGFGAGGAVSAAWVTGAAVAGTAGAAAITSGLAGVGAVVGGGMIAGLAVLTAPIAVLGLAGYGAFSLINGKRLYDRKRELIEEAVSIEKNLSVMIQPGVYMSKARRDYIMGLTMLIRDLVWRLQNDLEIPRQKF